MRPFTRHAARCRARTVSSDTCQVLQADNQSNVTGPAAPHVLDEDRGLVGARLGTLLQLASPAGTDLWRVGPITLEDVQQHLGRKARTNGLCAAHAHQRREPDPLSRPTCRPCEVGRVAWFVNHPDLQAGFEDPHPIALDAGYGPFIPDWPFTDGNHRLLAAELAGSPEDLLVVRIDGDWDRGVALLVDEADPDTVGYRT